MAMDNESKVEIVIVAGVAVVLAWLWYANRARGLDTGTSATIAPPAAQISTASGVPIGVGNLTIPDIPLTPADIFQQSFAGDTYDIGAISIGGVNIGATTIGGSALYIGAGQDGSCNCGGGTSDLGQYGSEGDLAAYLGGLTPVSSTPTTTIPGTVWAPIGRDPETISA